MDIFNRDTTSAQALNASKPTDRFFIKYAVVIFISAAGQQSLVCIEMEENQKQNPAKQVGMNVFIPSLQADVL